MARVEWSQPVLVRCVPAFQEHLSSQPRFPEDPPVSAPRNLFDTPWGPGFGLDWILDSSFLVSWFIPKKKEKRNKNNLSDFCLQLDLPLSLSTHDPKSIYKIISIVQPDLQVPTAYRKPKIKQGVCHIVALPFTLKSIFKRKKNYGNSNISPFQKYNVKKYPLKKTKIFQDIITL
jgi:hypothetical protein